jgi:hypothetical protein
MSYSLFNEIAVGCGLPQELEELPDPAPEPKGRVRSSDVAARGAGAAASDASDRGKLSPRLERSRIYDGPERCGRIPLCVLYTPERVHAMFARMRDNLHELADRHASEVESLRAELDEVRALYAELRAASLARQRAEAELARLLPRARDRTS